MTWKNSRPMAVVVSIAWVWLMKSMPSASNSASAAMSAPRERAKRSYFHTSTQSKRRRRASAISASNSGAARRRRRVASPPTRSTYSRWMAKPRIAAYSRNARSCASGFWSLVDTRA